LIDRYFICQAMLIFLDRTTGGGVSTSDIWSMEYTHWHNR
jgi:hypothetical protein